MRLNRARLFAWTIFVALVVGVLPGVPHGGLFDAPLAQAQNLGQRTVSGDVIDGNSNPVAGAIVFLKNLKTKSIRSYTSSKNGRFYFAQVNMAEDYDLWAEKDGKKSATKTVSSWDARKEFETELKMK
ncbi:MAG: carboxypeptidase-like regulatory domain-containing protein [Terracidiphilus sp.]